MKLAIEMTPSNAEGVVGLGALAELLRTMADGLDLQTFPVLQGPPQIRSVLLSINVLDQRTGTILTGKLVTTPPE